MSEINLKLGDCLDVLKTLKDNSVDSIVTDPPYGLKFMGKKWDTEVPKTEIWKECLRVLKPGGHLLAFAGTRTQHRMATHIEDAGFEIRDMIAWVYGSGFPKSLNIGKAIKVKSQWEGWGTALKPALEPITVARKPISETTVAKNVLKHGTGGINIDGCRVGTEEQLGREQRANNKYAMLQGGYEDKFQEGNTLGRFPANIIHDGSEEVLGCFPESGNGTGKQTRLTRKRKHFALSGSEDNIQEANAPDSYGDSGSAARFFYCSKVSSKERNDGANNNHPTVKPTKLMEYLIRLVTPKDGMVLDPFMGSGSTGIAAVKGGWSFTGIELSPEYLDIAKGRIENAEKEYINKLSKTIEETIFTKVGQME